MWRDGEMRGGDRESDQKKINEILPFCVLLLTSGNECVRGGEQKKIERMRLFSCSDNSQLRRMFQLR